MLYGTTADLSGSAVVSDTAVPRESALGVHAPYSATRKVHVRLPEKGSSNSHSARPVHLITAVHRESGLVSRAVFSQGTVLDRYGF